MPSALLGGGLDERRGGGRKIVRLLLGASSQADISHDPALSLVKSAAKSSEPNSVFLTEFYWGQFAEPHELVQRRPSDREYD